MSHPRRNASREGELAASYLAEKGPVAQARLLKQAAQNPGFARLLAARGQHSRREAELLRRKEERRRQAEAEELIRQGESERSDLLERERVAKLEYLKSYVARAEEKAKIAEREPRYRRVMERVPVYGLSGLPYKYELRERYIPLRSDSGEEA